MGVSRSPAVQLFGQDYLQSSQLLFMNDVRQ
jgi:hypothetical protein